MKIVLLLITLLFAGLVGQAAPPDQTAPHDVGYAISVPDAPSAYTAIDQSAELCQSTIVVTISDELLNLLDPQLINLQHPTPDNVYVPPAYEISYAGIFTKKAEGETGPKIDGVDWSSIINIVLGLISVIAGGILALVKKKGREVATALSTVLDAIEDNKVTPEEEKKIAAAIRAVFQKDLPAT